MEQTSSPAPDRLGRYRIDRKIGEGGMGIVYAAHDDRLGRTVALKALRGSVDDASRERLWREARAAAAISHPNICQLYEVEETSAGLVLAMELLAGESLAARLERGAVPAAETASIALQALNALDALHGRGLIHRDLKPSNLFLTPHGVKLLDFGLVRPMGDGGITGDGATRITEIGAIPGTPHYMAPEQVRGEALDARADLFSLAAVLFEMLSGRLAFNGPTVVDTLHAVLHEQPPALTGGGAVAGLDRVIHKALQKSADDRYPSAAAMADAIRAAMAARTSSDTTVAETRTMTRLVALPFRVLRPDPETDFLAFSLPDAIAGSLAGTRNLLVRSSAAAARFDPVAPDLRQLAADADIDVALMGTILRAGTQLRASAQLVEAPAGTVLWSHTAQYALQDVFALQDDLVAGIVGSLAKSLGTSGRTARRDVPRSAEAYDLFLRANGLARDYDRMSEARDLYRRCVELDPEFAPAWAALGRSWRVLGKYFSVPDGAVEAERAFERAQQLNPDLPALHNYYAQLECDAGRAVDAMRRLLGQARRSNSAEHFAGLVHACRYTGLLAASLAAHDEARRLDPTIRTSVHNTFMLIGDFERLAREVAADDPELVAMALYRLGRRAEAAAIRRISTADAAPQMKAWDDLMVACFTGAPNAREIAEKTTELGSWNDPEGLMFHGAILSHLGSTELAVKLLRASVDGGFYVPSVLLRDPWLDPLRHDARFGEIVALAQARSREALAVFRAEGGERLLGAIADAA